MAQAEAIPVVTGNSRVDGLLAQMTLDEKLTLITGKSVSSAPDPENQSQAGYLPGIERLGIPSLTLADGPPGVVTKEESTGMVSTQGLAATWNTDRAYADGKVIGKDAEALGQDVVLEPFINMNRDTSASRTWNTFGEDPYLTSRLAAATVKGIQKNGTMAQAKHYVAADGANNILMDEQTFHEVYAAPFDAAIQAGVSSIMCAYNATNVKGETDTSAKISMCGSEYLLTTALRDEMGFTGFVTSDWGGTHATDNLAAGLDMEMPGSSFFTPDKVKAAIDAGSVTEAQVTTAVGRILYTYDRFGLLDKAPKHAVTAENRRYDNAVIEETAEQAAVLLKNESNILPLSSSKTVALIGPGAGQTIATYGTGEKSGGIAAEQQVGTYDVLAKRLGTKKVSYAVANDMTGEPVPASALSHDDEPGLVRTTTGASDTTVDDQVWFTNEKGNALPAGSVNSWKGTLTAPEDGKYWINVGVLGSTASMKIDGNSYGGGGFGGGARYGALHANEGNGPMPATDNIANFRYEVTLTEGDHTIELSNALDKSNDAVQIRLSWVTPSQRTANRQAAIDAAKAAKVAVVFAYATQEGDLSSALPEGQDQLIEDVAAANPNTVVVLNNNQPIAMPWLSKVKGVLEMWFPGDRGGWATANVLQGKVNPGGKLPMTWPKSIGQELAHQDDHPERASAGVGESCGFVGGIANPWNCPVTTYSEGLNVGYRFFDKEDQTPLYAFGYGLSYTKFSYSSLKVRKAGDGGLNVYVRISNNGSRTGDAVPQVYLGRPRDVPSGVKFASTALAGFDRVTIKAHHSKYVKIHVPLRQLQYWDSEADQWVKATGQRTLSLNSSATRTERMTAITVS
ncbi:beta-glucosidase [Propionicimonas sp. T2.31MG-18]|uniref:beta-glucosidase family protein n=1 Tax=Propionicimonas sp. T2.31MG-18 TaxID=3157620 RepID=UPI00366C7DB5